MYDWGVLTLVIVGFLFGTGHRPRVIYGLVSYFEFKHLPSSVGNEKYGKAIITAGKLKMEDDLTFFM